MKGRSSRYAWLFAAFFAATALWAPTIRAVEWSYSWPGSSTPKGSVCELLYDKDWAYCVEIDDGPATVASVSVDFFAKYRYTDAPPGVKGGKSLPVVGNAAIIVDAIGANETLLNHDTIREILSKGWGLANHSYAHRGRTWGKPPEILTDEEIREDLYWSQSILASDYGGGRAPAHFVFPNGYTDYNKLFAEFGILSGSRVGGSGSRKLFGGKANWIDFSRAHLDEGKWAGPGQGDPLFEFPQESGFEHGHVQIDFTHGTNPDPESPNQLRWKARMEHIASRYGEEGDDSFWSAPAEKIFQYALASKQASLEITPGRLTVKLPDDAPGSPLTIKLDGIPESTPLPVPEGGLLYRKGSTAWITTPCLGKSGANPPKPEIRRVFSGPVGTHTFDAPVQLAGVQVFHIGGPKERTPVEVILTLADGSKEALTPKVLEPKWSKGYMLFSIVPERPAILVKGVEVPEKSTLKTMELWAVKE